MRALLTLTLLTATGCTMVHAVGGTGKDGEFYLVAQKTGLGMPGNDRDQPVFVLAAKIAGEQAEPAKQ